MKFCWVTLHVSNMERSLNFYTQIAGLTVDHDMKLGPNRRIAFLGAGETKLELIDDVSRKDQSFGKDISIGFETDSLEALSQTLKAKDIPVESGPHQPNPTLKFIYVLDPDGVHVQFIEHIQPGR